MTQSATAIAQAVRQGTLSARQALDQAYERLEHLNPEINAFVQIDRDAAVAAADAVDARVSRGLDPGPLAGVPIGVKDLEPCSGYRLTQGSWFLKDIAPETSDSRHVARLRSAGAVIIGITASSEFGMDSATNTLLYGVTRNPWDIRTTPGGSSGGSSAAVAAGIVPLATGTDAGGSIRAPAAFTGIVGLKPSHGRIPKMNGFSNWGVHGALAATVADAALHLDAVCGPDDGDRQSLPHPGYRYRDVIETLDVSGMRAVFSPDYGYAAVESEIVAIAREAAERLIRAAGLQRCETDFSPVNIYPHWGAIFGSTLEDDFTKAGYLPDGYDKLSNSVRRVVDRVRARRAAGGIDVQKSWAQVHLLEQQVADFFRSHDLLLSPAVSCRAYGAEDSPPAEIEGKDASSGGAEPFGMLANACWNPSISIPAGITSDGLPVGLQIVARRHRDDICLRLARIMERSHPWPLLW
jgi:aspartyl-tRNA(Asn)/glutamyl-tRNA(Gln) amidotransferase subunit A